MNQLFLQPATLIATVIILYLHFDRKRLNFKDEVMFSYIIVFNLLSIVLEIVLIISATASGAVKQNVVTACGILYGICLIFEMYLINRYLYVRLKNEFNTPGTFVNILPVILFFAAALLYPIQAFVKNGMFQLAGIPIYCLGIIMIYYGIMMVVRVFDNSFFEKPGYKTVLFYSSFAVICGLLLIFVRGTLFTGGVMSFVIWLLYCRFDNPERYLDHSTNTFNHETFYTVMDECLIKKKDYALITFSLKEYPMLTEVFGIRAVERLLVEVMDYFEHYAGKYIFRLETNLFCLCVDTDRDSFEIVSEIHKRFSDNWNIGGLEVMLKPAFSFHKSILSFSSAVELEEAVTYFAVEGRRKEDVPILLVNDDLLRERRKFIDMQRVLERAITRDEIEVYYQPIYCVKSGKYVGLEALARLRTEDGELLCAEEFINYAEAGYKLIKLGDAIFRKVCRFARSFDFEGSGIEYVSVNLSKLQCIQEDLAYKMNLIMSEYSIPPYRIRFEILRPEGAAMIISNMRELARYGSGITLDKCSIGFSGRLLKNDAKVSLIKMDFSLFKEYTASAELMKPLEDTIKMLHSLDYDVCISSVETMEQYQIAKQLGVEYIQGFYLSDALSPEKVKNFIQDWQ